MKLGDIELKVDQEIIKDLEQLDKVFSVKVVGVFNYYLWEMGIMDVMYLLVQIFMFNKQILSVVLMGIWVNVNVEFQYIVYEYDPLAKKYFKSNFTDAVLKGILEKNGDDLNLLVVDDEFCEVQLLKNFICQIGIKPQMLEQSVNLVIGFVKNIVKQWGVMEVVK